MTRRLLSAAEVADQLHRPVEWLYRNKDRLVRDEGFPAPVTAIGNVWDSAAIDAWLDSRMAPHLRQIARAAKPGSDEDWSNRLMQRVESGEAYGD